MKSHTTDSDRLVKILCFRVSDRVADAGVCVSKSGVKDEVADWWHVHIKQEQDTDPAAVNYHVPSHVTHLVYFWMCLLFGFCFTQFTVYNITMLLCYLTSQFV